jgi:hypothetical protein
MSARIVLCPASVVGSVLSQTIIPHPALSSNQRWAHYIAFHSLDQKLVKMTVGCGLCHINTKHMYSTTEIFTQENTVVKHEAIQVKFSHIATDG